MAKITLEEAKEYAVLPPDSIVLLTVKEVAVREVNTNGRPWEKLEITFNIDEVQATGDGSDPSNYQTVVDSVIWGSVAFRFNDSPENKLKIWTEAILNMRDLGVGFELDTDYFIGRKVRGVTSQYEKRDKGADGRPIKRHQIASLLPLGQQETAQPIAPPAQTLQPQGAGWQSEEPPF